MELIYLYIPFAITTAIVGYFWLLIPALKMLKELNPESEFVTNKVTKFQIQLVMSIFLLLAAPFTFLIFINSAYSSRFIQTLATDLSKH